MKTTILGFVLLFTACTTQIPPTPEQELAVTQCDDLVGLYCDRELPCGFSHETCVAAFSGRCDCGSATAVHGNLEECRDEFDNLDQDLICKGYYPTVCKGTFESSDVGNCPIF